MSSIAIAHETFLSRFAGELLAAVPPGLLRLLRGPTILLRIDEGTATLSTVRLLGRPVMLEVAPSFVLKRRLTIPAAGRRDLPFAVELLIGAETPFAADEVLADVCFVRALPETGEMAFEVRIIPRQKIMGALAQFRLKPSQVQGIAIAGDLRPFSVSGLAAPRRTFLRAHIGWLAPLAIGLGASATGMYFETGSRGALIAALEQKVDAELATLRAELQELDERDAGAEQERAVREAFAATPSSFAVLNAMRANLPAGTFVSRVQMQRGEFRLSVGTPDALRDVKALQEALGEYDVRIEGSVVDMDDGLQSTVFLVTAPAQP